MEKTQPDRMANLWLKHLVEGSHGLDHFLGEGSPNARGSDQHSWLDGLDSLQQGLHGFMLMCPWLLEVLKRLFSRLNNQSLHIQQKIVLADKKYRMFVLIAIFNNVVAVPDLRVHEPDLLAALFNRGISLLNNQSVRYFLTKQIFTSWINESIQSGSIPVLTSQEQ